MKKLMLFLIFLVFFLSCHYSKSINLEKRELVPISTNTTISFFVLSQSIVEIPVYRYLYKDGNGRIIHDYHPIEKVSFYRVVGLKKPYCEIYTIKGDYKYKGKYGYRGCRLKAFLPSDLNNINMLICRRER